MKFINIRKQLKNDHLYKLYDNKYIITGTITTKPYTFTLQSVQKGEMGHFYKSWKVLSHDLSTVRHDDKDYDSDKWAFYEIGTKEENPEYWL